MKAFIVLLVLTVAAGAGAGWYWRAGGETQPEFRTLPAQRGELLIAVTAAGTVEPMEVIDVGSQIAGRIQSFGFGAENEQETIDFGSRVRQGSILARLDDSPYQAELQKAQAALRVAEAERSRSQARSAQAERDFQRAETLRGSNAEADYDMAVAQHEMAKAEVAVAEARVEQAKIAVETAEINLGYTIIESPIDGMVIDRRVNVGQTVVVGLNAPSLFLLARDLRQLRIWAAVNEADIGDIRVGQPVTFKVDAYREDTFAGTVRQIRLNAGMLHNVVTYGVIVDIDNTDGKLLPYMTANLQFEVARRSDVLLVPNQALRWQPTWNQVSAAARGQLAAPSSAGDQEQAKVELASPAVWVVAEDGLVRPILVETGLTDGVSTEVAQGSLKPGAEVVVSVVRQAQPDFVSGFIDKVTK